MLLWSPCRQNSGPQIHVATPPPLGYMAGGGGRFQNGQGQYMSLESQVKGVASVKLGCLTHVCSVPQSAEKLQESPCIFALTPRQVEMIRNSRWGPAGSGASPSSSSSMPGAPQARTSSDEAQRPLGAMGVGEPGLSLPCLPRQRSSWGGWVL